MTFADHTRLRRLLELRGEPDPMPEVRRRWQESLCSLTLFYGKVEDGEVAARALADPYFPVTMLQRLNVEAFATGPQGAGVSEGQVGTMIAADLLEWAKIFLSIRSDLASLNRGGRISGLGLTGSVREFLPEGGWCDYCGGCCEIRGGPPEFSGDFTPPDRWLRYFRGDACEHQRFCPFLFEYFATARFFCSVYKVKPRCCWAFGREECDFLKEDVARERAERSGIRNYNTPASLSRAGAQFYGRLPGRLILTISHCACNYNFCVKQTRLRTCEFSRPGTPGVAHHAVDRP
jgi:hypothetical protein